MNLQKNWPQIRSTFESSIRSSLHCSIASIREDGYPHVTPIGHIFLRDDQTAFYFEEHTRATAAESAAQPTRLSVLPCEPILYPHMTTGLWK